MKAKFGSTTIFLSITLLLLISACSDNKEEISALTAENALIRSEYEQQLLATKTAVARADSLHTVVHRLESEVNKLRGEVPTYNASSEDEKAIEQLVSNLQKAWTVMLQNNDPNELLRYFMPQYTTSTVRVNTENIPSVVRKNNSNFEEHLNELLLANEVSISFGQTKFLYTEVKGDIFVTSYTTRIRVYEKNKQMHTSSLVTQLAGQRKDGSWKVGNYHWVTFNY